MNEFETLSSNSWSHDLQVFDALAWLADIAPTAYAGILAKFPEIVSPVWSARWRDDSVSESWLDTDAMSVDVEFSSWLCDAIEETGLVMWSDGEPFGSVSGDFSAFYD